MILGPAVGATGASARHIFDQLCARDLTNEDRQPGSPNVVAVGWSLIWWPEFLAGPENVERTRVAWVQMFRAVGYSHECFNAARPNGPIQLWRGAPEDRVAGMSWTTQRHIAELHLHSSRWVSGGVRKVAKLWTATVEPVAVLARVSSSMPVTDLSSVNGLFPGARLDEVDLYEHVVDPAYLTPDRITEVQQ